MAANRSGQTARCPRTRAARRGNLLHILERNPGAQTAWGFRSWNTKVSVLRLALCFLTEKQLSQLRTETRLHGYLAQVVKKPLQYSDQINEGRISPFPDLANSLHYGLQREKVASALCYPAACQRCWYPGLEEAPELSGFAIVDQ